MPRQRSTSPSQPHHHRSRSPRRSHSRSTSRPRRETSRDRSPRRRTDDRPRKSGGGGFRWKEKPSHDGRSDRGDEGRLERGYRDQAKPRRRSPVRDGGGRDDIEEKFGRRDEIAEKFGTRDAVTDTVGKKDDVVADKFGEGGEPRKEKEKKKKKEKEKGRTAPAPAATGEPMIIVNVNDRLGTKASIPCLASDPIKLFKAQVAARIGREPHEIMLKRQGERPFKDQLTLEDYGVSNGVQLDLEVDTGD